MAMKAKKIIGYIRVSDANKASGEAQRAAIESYVERNNLTLDSIIEEHISATTTELKDRKLFALINSNQNIVVSDITRIGRNKVFGLISVISQITENGGELHLAYDDRVINSENADDAETIFTVVGQSFASHVEACKRSDRAKAGHSKRKKQGLPIGRKHGQVVKSKLDEHLSFILAHQDKGTKTTELLKLLESEKDLKISKAGYYKWLKKTQKHNQLI